jgi:hypothetical protein
MAEPKRPMDGPKERLLEARLHRRSESAGNSDTFSYGKKNSLRSDTFIPYRKGIAIPLG